MSRWLTTAAAAIAFAGGLAIFDGSPGPGQAHQQDFHHDSKSAVLTPASWPDSRLTIANLGHASLLMDFFGVRLITDPTLYDRVGFSVDSLLTIGPHRLVPPPLAPSQLGRLDLILITHAHMDHLDLPSLSALPKNVVVVACEKCGRLIRPLGFTDVRTLRWGEHTEVDGLKITAMAARHWGQRWPPFGMDYGYNSYILEKNGHRMLLACDTGYTDLFRQLNGAPLDVAAFSIAAYDPWIRNHANPEQVWRMFRQTGADYLVPLHWGTFRLSKEPMDEPMRRLITASGNESNRIVIKTIGTSWTMPMAPARQVRLTSPAGTN